ncbi:MAG: hypothetical protein HY292_13300 [Planctomycetes bacterium]|nr:hypothetical protein [Planctomycetota bacterium]
MRRIRNVLQSCAPFALVLGISACDANDLVSLRIRLKDDFSGTVVTSSLATPLAGPVDQASRGVAWKDRLAVIGTAGSFDDVSKLAIDDVTFASGKTPDGTSYLSITLPFGPASRWARTLVPMTSEERTRIAPIFDPTGEVKTLAAKIKFEIELPAAPTAHGVSPPVTGVKEEVEDNKATLLVPVDAVLGTSRTMTWQLTWRK